MRENSKNKNWWAPLRVGLFTDPKHREKMGQAVWLYCYLHAYADRENGRLIRNYSQIADEVKTTPKTVQRWMKILEENGYIQLRRLQYGFSIQIEKYRPISTKNREDNSVQSETEKEDSRVDNFGIQSGHFEGSDRTFPRRMDNSVQSGCSRKIRDLNAREDNSVQSLKVKRKIKEIKQCQESEIPDDFKNENSVKTCQRKYSPEDFQLAEKFFEKLKILNPSHKKPNLESWASDIRITREQDGRTHAEILELFSWANSNDFWRSNILSPSKLRAKWDQLQIQKNRPTQNTGYRSQADLNASGGGLVL